MLSNNVYSCLIKLNHKTYSTRIIFMKTGLFRFFQYTSHLTFFGIFINFLKHFNEISNITRLKYHF